MHCTFVQMPCSRAFTSLSCCIPCGPQWCEGRPTADDAPEDGVLEVQVVRALVQDEELRGAHNKSAARSALGFFASSRNSPPLFLTLQHDNRAPAFVLHGEWIGPKVFQS